MTLKEFYENIGENYESVRVRLITEERIRKYLSKLPADRSYAILRSAVEGGNLSDAFRAAHTLRGLCLNFGLNRSAKCFSDLTEALRPQMENSEIGPLFARAAEEYERLLSALKLFLAESGTGEGETK